MSERLKTILAELRRRLKILYGPRLVNLILFGSQARGDAEPGSDIDILVVLKGPVSPDEEITRAGAIVSEVSLAHGEVICCLFMDEDRFTSRNGPLLRNVRREGVPV